VRSRHIPDFTWSALSAVEGGAGAGGGADGRATGAVAADGGANAAGGPDGRTAVDGARAADADADADAPGLADSVGAGAGTAGSSGAVVAAGAAAGTSTVVVAAPDDGAAAADWRAPRHTSRPPAPRPTTPMSAAPATIATMRPRAEPVAAAFIE
jgi:hypothetical protein